MSTDGTPRSRGALARRRVATGAVLAGLVVAAFEATVVSPAMPTIVRELGGMSAYASVFSVFLVASTLAVVLCGRLADALGRLPVFVGGMVLFLAGSVLCGAATSFGALVAFRVVQGLGAGALQPIAMTISADLYTLDERARIQGVFTGAWGAASIVGPVIGGLLVMHASWRWVFLVNVPVGLLAVVLLLVSYRDPPRPRRPSVPEVPPQAGRRPEGHTRTEVPPQAGRRPEGHARKALAALVPLEALRSQAVRAGLVTSVVAGGIVSACSAYVPLWMTAQVGGSALAAGGALVPLLGGWALGSSFGVRVLVLRGMRASVGGGFAIALAGALGLALAAVGGMPTIFALASLGVLGLGLGPAASTSLVGPQSCVAWQHRGAVTSAVYAARLLGGSVVVAVLGLFGGGPQAEASARFGALAVLALGGVAAALLLAPRVASLRLSSETASAPSPSAAAPG